MEHEEIMALITYGQILKNWNEDNLVDFFENNKSFYKIDEDYYSMTKEELIQLKNNIIDSIVEKGNEYIENKRKEFKNEDK